MPTTDEALASTALLVAAVRAEESGRQDRLFSDPFAEQLAGPRGRRLLAAAKAAVGDAPTVPIVIRTRFWDDALLRARLPQVVILAAGMDSRAYRLPWPTGTTLYELDQPPVITTKNDVLAGQPARCDRIAIGADLADDWPKALCAHGFRGEAPTAWLVEGLLQYLDASAVNRLFDRINALSAPGSVLCYDVIGETMLKASSMATTLESMKQLGAPWIFGTDEPATLVEDRGWCAAVTNLSEPANKWNRPLATAAGRGDPRGYLVEAKKA